MKAVSALISTVLLMAVVIGAISIMLSGIRPSVTALQDSVIFGKMKQSMATIDSAINTVASEADGSRRSVAIKISKGRLTVNGSSDTLIYSIETSAGGVAPRTSVEEGMLTIVSGGGVAAYRGNYTLDGNQIPSYVLENSHTRIYIRAVGSRSSPAAINTSQLILAAHQKDQNVWVENMAEFSVDGQESSKAGSGYTELFGEGNGLASSTVSAYVSSGYIGYYINFTLESDTDFLEIGGQTI